MLIHEYNCTITDWMSFKVSDISRDAQSILSNYQPTI